jgi:trimeric autotransporter adhesin
MSIFTKIFSIILSALLLCGNAYNGYSTAWTTATAGGINVLANWTNGTSAPTTFATPGDTWVINKSMTLAPGGTWTVGTVSSALDSVTFATGGTLDCTGSGSAIANATIYGNVFNTGGTISRGGSGSTRLALNVYGNYSMTGGTVNTGGSGSGGVTLNVYGNFSMTAGTVSTSGSANYGYLYNYGNFSMTGGTFTAGGAGTTLMSYIYGNFSVSGASAMTNTGAGAINTVHLALNRAGGTMLIDNTSTGAWSKTNIFVDTNCVAQLDGDFSTTTGTAAYGLTVDGTLICPAAYTVNGTRMFALNGVATLKVAHATGINGAIVTSGTRTFSNSANYEFNGTVAQVTGSYMPASLVAPDTITINNSLFVTLSQATATTGKLGFASGLLKTGAYTMTVPGASSSVYGAGPTSYVFGTLIKTITGLTSVNYEVGDTSYAPMSLAFSTAGTAGSIGLMVTAGLHTSVATSGILTTNIAAHYWTITNLSAAGPATVTPAATYALSTIIGGTNVSFKTQKYSGAAWLGAALATTNTATPYTSTPTSGIALGSLAGDYIFGNEFCGTLPITGPATSLCEGATLALSDATTGGAWVSATTAVGTVSSAGVVTGVSAGTVIISYTASGCTVTTVLTINPLPNAGTITGTDTAVCVGRNITFTDAATGGVWSSSNPALGTVSGSVTVTGVAPGIDTIIYTVTNGCGTATAKRRVRVVSIATCHTYASALERPATELKIFPDPNQGTFTVDLVSENDEQVNMVIVNLLGRVVKEFTATTNEEMEIRLDPVPGIYLLSAANTNGRYTAKFIIE